MSDIEYPIVDRDGEYNEDPEVIVFLDENHKERFFVQGLTDDEYIKRAEYLRET